MGVFDYSDFIARLDKAGFTDQQSVPLNMRLDLLESYVDVKPRPLMRMDPKTKKLAPFDQFKNVPYTPRIPEGEPDHLAGVSGELTIIDLTDPVVEPDAACVLFDVCLSIFMSRTKCAKIVALDEAHNYMTTSNSAAAQFAERLLKIIRQQRHEGARVVIATQEPSINLRLLDLCNITMVHRFTSPAWFAVLKEHIAAMKGIDDQKVFEEIVRLKVGESLLFCPTAATATAEASNELTTMGTRYFKFRTRTRQTADGGRSKLADGS
jgi:DNA helicase HerA-like ATPase